LSHYASPKSHCFNNLILILVYLYKDCYHKCPVLEALPHLVVLLGAGGTFKRQGLVEELGHWGHTLKGRGLWDANVLLSLFSH
jgi:hypothetical protein